MRKAQGCYLHQHLSVFWSRRAEFLSSHRVIALLTLITASVWLVFGAWFKLLGMVPRHRLIITAVVGEAAAGPLTLLVGAAETALALWIINRRLPAVLPPGLILTQYQPPRTAQSNSPNPLRAPWL